MTETAGVGDLCVSALISDSVTCIAPDASLHQVARALTDGAIGALVVGDTDSVAGIVSERDVVQAIAGHQDPSKVRAAAIASTDLVWCDASAGIAEVAARMMERYVRHVLIEEDGALLGIVSARDLLGAYAAADMDFD